MAKDRTGSLTARTDAKGKTYYRGRIRLGDQSRMWLDVPPGYTEKRARAFLLVAQADEDRTGAFLARKLRGKNVAPPGAETVAAWSERWLVDRAARGNESMSTDRGRLKQHVLPILGDTLMPDVTTAQIEDVRDAIDAKIKADTIAWKTGTHIWGLVTKMFADARASKNRELRARKDNPTTDVKPPDRGRRVGKVYLYPGEFLALVSCPKVPLHFRRLCALAVYLYSRAGELNGLTWEKSIDLERGVAHIHTSVDRNTGKRKTTKTDLARKLPIEPNLSPLLRAMHKEADGKGRVVTSNETDRKLWLKLRRSLLKAGVTRTELHEKLPGAKVMTFHDLRATGITWCAVRGDDPLRLKQRAGHRTFSTTEQYIREAENLGTLIGEVFPPLPECLLVNPLEHWDNDRDNGDETVDDLAEKVSGGAGNRTQVNGAVSISKDDILEGSDTEPPPVARDRGTKETLIGSTLGQWPDVDQERVGGAEALSEASSLAQGGHARPLNAGPARRRYEAPSVKGIAPGEAAERALRQGVVTRLGGGS